MPILRLMEWILSASEETALLFRLLQEVRLTTNPWEGAVLHPTIEALQIAEIASLNNRVYRTLGSSVIVPKKDKIEITPTRPGFHIISVDNSTYSYRNIAKVEYQIDNHKINFVASSSHTSFWNRVKDAFIGDDRE